MNAILSTFCPFKKYDRSGGSRFAIMISFLRIYFTIEKLVYKLQFHIKVKQYDRPCIKKTT